MAHKIGLTYERRKATLEIGFSNEHTGALFSVRRKAMLAIVFSNKHTRALLSGTE